MFTSAPTITVTGDGTSAHVNAVLTDTGSVGNLLITNKGSLHRSEYSDAFVFRRWRIGPYDDAGCYHS